MDTHGFKSTVKRTRGKHDELRRIETSNAIFFNKKCLGKVKGPGKKKTGKYLIAIKFTIEIPCSENGAVHPNDIVWEFIFVYYDWTLFTTNTCGYRQYSVFPSSYTLGVLVPVVRKTTGEISVNKLIYYSAAVIIWEMTHFERQRKKGLCSLLFTFLSLRPSYRRFRFRFCHCRFFKSVHFFFSRPSH